MKVLITGAHGFIGEHLVRRMGDCFRVAAPSSRTLNLTDPVAVEDYLRVHRFDAVIHAATWNATVTSTRDLSLVLRQNLRMYFALIRCRNLFGSLVYFGSGAEYDRRAWHARMPEACFGQSLPEDDYGFSKYIVECVHGEADPVWNLRLFGVYGPGEDWRIRFISNACCRALFDMPIVLRQNRRFDYTWVDDVPEVTRRVLMERPTARTMNVSAAEIWELIDLAGLVREISGKDVPIQVKKEGMGKEYSADTKLMHTQLPGLVFTSMESGVSRLYEWYRSHRDQIRPELL